MKTIQFCSFIVFALSLTFSAAHADDTHGIFMVVKGDIKITGKDGKTDPAKVGKKVFSGDTITAGTDSRAKVVMSDKNVLNVSPDSKIVIEKYENNGKEKNVELNVLYGKVRASVEQKYDGEKSKFNVKTPSAVAGVRGTDFITGYNPTTKVSQVITFSGVVAVGTLGANGAIANAVFVRPGQMSSTAEGRAPEAPQAVPAEDLNNINNESASNSSATRTVASDAPAGPSNDMAPSAEDRAPASPAPAPAMATVKPPEPPKPPVNTRIQEAVRQGQKLRVPIVIVPQ